MANVHVQALCCQSSLLKHAFVQKWEEIQCHCFDLLQPYTNL